MSRFAKLAAAVLGTVALVGSLAACSSAATPTATAGASSAADDLGTAAHPVKIGVVGASDPYWTDYKAAAEAAGIKVEIVDFTEYSQPNPALSANEIDVNQFQHVLYLAQYNAASNDTLVPIGSTAIYPLGLYSQKYKTPAEIPAGETVAVPNDESNGARALLVLQSAGLIKLKDGGSPFSKPEDVLPESKVKVTALEASLAATSLPDVAAAVINNDFIENAGLKASDAIAQDDPNDPKAQVYINIFATTAANKDNATLLKLVEIYQNDAKTQEGVVAKSGGTAVMLKTPVEELQAALTTATEQYKTNKK